MMRPVHSPSSVGYGFNNTGNDAKTDPPSSVQTNKRLVKYDFMNVIYVNKLK